MKQLNRVNLSNRQLLKKIKSSVQISSSLNIESLFSGWVHQADPDFSGHNPTEGRSGMPFTAVVTLVTEERPGQTLTFFPSNYQFIS